MQVTVYSTTTCPYCQMLKKYFDEKKIVYTEKLVDQDDAARAQMMNDSGGFLGVPFTVVVRDGEEKETIIGFDKGKIDQIFGAS